MTALARARQRRLHILAHVGMAVSMAALGPARLPAASARLVAGGAFGKAAGLDNLRKLVQWRGMHPGEPEEWLQVSSDPFGPMDDVRALAFDPSSRWLIVGGVFENSEKRGGALLKFTQPLGRDPEAMQYFYAPTPSGDLKAIGKVYALEHWSKFGQAGDASNKVEWHLFVGGDFLSMSSVNSDANPVEARFVARCVYTTSRDQLYGSCQFESLPPREPDKAIDAPDSPVHMLAFDGDTEILYAGGKNGPLRRYHVSTETWSLLQRPVGVGSTAQLLGIAFDRPSGLGFIAFAGDDAMTSRSQGVHVFQRGPSVAEPGVRHEVAGPESMQQVSAYVSALTVGIDDVQQCRGVFAAGSKQDSANGMYHPALWFMPIDCQNGTASAFWQDRNLPIDSARCAPRNIARDKIFTSLAFLQNDKTLVVAGNFVLSASPTACATNIARSSDAGRTWRELTGPNGLEGLDQVRVNASAVNTVLEVPEVDVTAVCPTHVSPFGGANLTVWGLGFKTFTGANNHLLVKVGVSMCPTSEWVSDTYLTCRVPQGFGDSLPVSVGFGSPENPEFQAFKRGEAFFSYSAPVLGSFGKLTDPMSASIGGDKVITILGYNFGYTIQSIKAIKVGESTCHDGAWISDSSMKCTLAPAGVRPVSDSTTGLIITAKFSNRDDSQASTQRFSYLPPMVSQLMPSAVPTKGMQTSEKVTILGKSFGSDAGTVRRMKLGATECAPLDWTSDTSMACKTGVPGPGVGILNISLVVANQTCTDGCLHAQDDSTTSLLRYEKPQIKSLKYDLLDPAGGGSVIISGSGFGVDNLDSVFLGSSKCKVVAGGWTEDQIICLAPPGAGDQLKLIVDARGQSAVADELVGYRPPTLDSFTPRVLPREAGSVVTVRGQFFVSNPGVYKAIWIFMNDLSSTEHLGSIISITKVDKSRRDSEHELLIRVPVMPGRGRAVFFVRAGVAQESNRLDPTCHDEPIGSAKACIHFSERSPLIAVDVDATVLEQKGKRAGCSGYNIGQWRDKLANFLNMQTPSLLFVKECAVSDRRSSSLRRVSVVLKVQLYILSNFEDAWSYRSVLETLKAHLNAATGRHELKNTLGILAVAVCSRFARTLSARAHNQGHHWCRRMRTRMHA